MIWNEPATTEDSHADLENRLWAAANKLWADAALKPSEFSPIVLGLIFLRYAETRFLAVEKEIGPSTGRRKVGPADYHAKGALYLPEDARFGHLLKLPESGNMGQAVNDAMRAVEKENPDLADVLPKTYQILENRTLAELLKVIASISIKDGDTFGLIYEYFLGKFAMSEGQKGGEFYTPTSIVRLIVEILEPYHGRIYDPACGSGGMFIQSARFVEAHRANRTLTPGPSPSGRGGNYTGDATKEISCHGQERVTETGRLARLNLAVHGLQGDIKQGNTYYEDLHRSTEPVESSPSPQPSPTGRGSSNHPSTSGGRAGDEGHETERHGRFDFVMANPPFNVSKIDKDRLAADPRYAFGLPRTDNGNYLWIQHFHAALNAKGRAGFVMANSAADARASEQEIREKLIQTGHVDVMVSIGPNFFYTVTLPCTLWFFDKRKSKSENQQSSVVNRKDTVLFLDARHIYRQLDRAHRDFTPAQIEFLANVVRLYRGQAPEFRDGSEEKVRELFFLPSPSGRKAGDGGLPGFAYRDVPGLCKAATLKEIEAQGWSLNPGRYVGVAKGDDLSDEDFKAQLETLNEELEVLNVEARELEETIAANVAEILLA